MKLLAAGHSVTRAHRKTGRRKRKREREERPGQGGLTPAVGHAPAEKRGGAVLKRQSQNYNPREGVWFQAAGGSGLGPDDRGYGFLHWLVP